MMQEEKEKYINLWVVCNIYKENEWHSVLALISQHRQMIKNWWVKQTLQKCDDEQNSKI